MSSLQTLEKQPSESRLYTMEFAPNMSLGETVNAVTSVTATPPGLTLSGSPTFTGTRATQRILGGTNSTLYKITFIVTTSLGNTLEGEGNLRVADL